MDLTEAVQRAVVARLRGDAALALLVGDRVHDHAPEDAPMPYVSLGAQSAEPVGDAACLDGEDIAIQIDIWSRQPGRIEAGRIMDRVARLLNEVALPLAAPHHPATAWVEAKRLFDEGLQRHGIVSVIVAADRGA